MLQHGHIIKGPQEEDSEILGLVTSQAYWACNQSGMDVFLEWFLECSYGEGGNMEYFREDPRSPIERTSVHGNMN